MNENGVVAPAPRTRPEPRVEMVRLVGESAHIGDAHVQQVPGIVGGVGEPAAERLARFDHHDFVVRRVEPPREMRRREDPGRAAADDREFAWRLHTVYYYYRQTESVLVKSAAASRRFTGSRRI